MLKEYFTDGLIQIAILLSLLRTDLSTLLSTVNQADYADLQEIILGQTSAFTQTHIQSPYWDYGHAHPKNIESYYARSIFDELNSLGRYRQFDGVDTSIESWLVSLGPSHVSTPAPAESSNSGSGESQSGSQDGGNVQHDGQSLPVGSVQISPGNGESSSHEGAVGEVQNWWANVFPGSDLTKEDMDLIDILWRQDIDLGVGREAYDIGLRKELEKEQELEQKKLKEKEEKLNAKSEDGDGQFTYEVDGETGEVVPIPISRTIQGTTSQPQEPQVDASSLLGEEEGFSVEDAMRLLEQQSPPEVIPSPTNASYAQQLDPNAVPVPDMAAFNQMPAFGTNMSLPQPQAQLNATDPADYVANADLESLINTLQNFTHAPNEEESFSRQTSFEQRWNDVASLLDLPPPNVSASSAMNDTMGMAVNDTFSTQSPLIRNATLPSQPINTGLNQPSTPLDTLPSPNVTAPYQFQNASLPNGSGSNSLYNMDTQDVLFPNLTSAPLLGNASMLQDLLRDDLLEEMDLDLPEGDSNATNQNDDASSDSAVSMSVDSQDCDMSNTSSTSAFDGIEGATGGNDYESETKYSTSVNKYIDCSQEFRQEDLHSNFSCGSNGSDFHRSSGADMRHVNHNHTYPLQPGQQPKEYPSKKGAADRSSESRDTRRAKETKLPFSVEDIVHSPVERFNEMMQKYSLTEAQLQLIRDIRRRGKNKVAAQNCRKRKMSAITDLEDEVINMRKEKERLAEESRLLDKQKKDFSSKMEQLYQEVFQSLRDDHGQPYDPNQYSIHQSENGDIFLVPKNGTTVADVPEKSSRKRKGKKQ